MRQQLAAERAKSDFFPMPQEQQRSSNGSVLRESLIGVLVPGASPFHWDTGLTRWCGYLAEEKRMLAVVDGPA